MKYKVCNKQIHQDVFNFESSIHNFAFFNEKLNMFESGEKYAQIKRHLQAAQNSSKWMSWEEALLWIRD